MSGALIDPRFLALDSSLIDSGSSLAVAKRWSQAFLSADHFSPLSAPTYVGGPAAFAPPVPLAWEAPNTGGMQGGKALTFGNPNAGGGPWGIAAACAWWTPHNFDNADLPFFQAVYGVNNAGAIGNRTIDLQCHYMPYEDQYVMSTDSVVWGALTRNVISPPAPTPEKRIYMTPEVQLSPSDPEGYLAIDMPWMVAVHRLPTADDYTGDCYFLGLRIRFLTT
jgi:hypothetical protein